MPWLTNKKTGKPFNTDWLDEDDKNKYRQIEANKREADEKNGKSRKATIYRSSTPEEIKQYYKDSYNIDVDDSYFKDGNDPQFLVDSVPQLNRVYSEFPELKNDNYLLASKNFESDKAVPQKYRNATALSYTGTGEIWLNTKVFNDYDELKLSYLGNVSQNKYPSGTTASNILVHELGHKLETVIARKIGVPEKELSLNATADTIVKFAYADIPKDYGFKTLQEARDSISHYAGKTFEVLPGMSMPINAETFAEAVSDYVSNGDNANAFSKSIIQYAKQLLH